MAGCDREQASTVGRGSSEEQLVKLVVFNPGGGLFDERLKSAKIPLRWSMQGGPSC